MLVTYTKIEKLRLTTDNVRIEKTIEAVIIKQVIRQDSIYI